MLLQYFQEDIHYVRSQKSKLEITIRDTKISLPQVVMASFDNYITILQEMMTNETLELFRFCAGSSNISVTSQPGSMGQVLLTSPFSSILLVFRKTKDLYLIMTQKLIILKSGRFHMKSGGFHRKTLQIKCFNKNSLV